MFVERSALLRRGSAVVEDGRLALLTEAKALPPMLMVE
jgi:hypothetical protein